MNATDQAAVEHYPPPSPEYQPATSPTHQSHSAVQNDEDSIPLLGHDDRGSSDQAAGENLYVNT